MAAAAILTKTPTTLLPKTLTLSRRLISTFPFLSQKPQLDEEPQDPPLPSSTSPLPPNPSSGSPLYQQNWRNPNAAAAASAAPASTQSIVPIGHSFKMASFSQTLDAASLMDVFADWMTSKRWSDLKQLFEFWVKSLDASGKPNKPDVNLFNHYLRANLMMGATAGELLDLLVEMEEYEIAPKAMK